jgi:hypothetical protein
MGILEPFGGGFSKYGMYRWLIRIIEAARYLIPNTSVRALSECELCGVTSGVIHFGVEEAGCLSNLLIYLVSLRLLYIKWSKKDLPH